MLAVEVIVAAAVLIGVALVAARPDIGGIDDPDTDRADIGLPTDRLLRSDDIVRLKFRVVAGWRGAVRGYRFSDVDATLVKVEEALRAAETGVAGRDPGAAGRDRGAAGRDRGVIGRDPHPPHPPHPPRTPSA